MFGNIAFDVVIGLIFIYLLYSLYATISMEIIASLIGLRAKNLRFALKRMLKDEKNYGSYWRNTLAAIGTTFSRFIGRATNLENPELYNLFKDQNTIKYLGSGGFGGRVSYLTADNFTKSLIDGIKTDDPDLSLMANFESGLQKLKLPVNSDTRKQIESLMDDAHGDPMKFKVLLDRWFNDTMERCNGWYKQSTQIVILIIGFFLVYNFNVDSISIIKKLSKDKAAREQMVKLATDFSQNNANAIAIIDLDTSQLQKEIKAKLESLEEIKGQLQLDMQKASDILSTAWCLPENLEYVTVIPDTLHKDSVLLRIDKLGGGIFLHKSVDSNLVLRMLRGKGQSGFCHYGPTRYKMAYIFSWSHILGYLLTILALSLGAPFWFDLLNKLVKLRTSKPVSDSVADGGSGSGVPGNNSGNPTSRVA